MLFLYYSEGKKISCCCKSYVYGKMLFFNTGWFTYLRPINGIINKHFVNLKCENWIIKRTRLSAQLSILRLDVDDGGISLMNTLLLSPLLPLALNPACILSAAVHGKDFSCVMSSWGLRCIFALSVQFGDWLNLCCTTNIRRIIICKAQACGIILNSLYSTNLLSFLLWAMLTFHWRTCF